MMIMTMNIIKNKTASVCILKYRKVIERLISLSICIQLSVLSVFGLVSPVRIIREIASGIEREIERDRETQAPAHYREGNKSRKKIHNKTLKRYAQGIKMNNEAAERQRANQVNLEAVCVYRLPPPFSISPSSRTYVCPQKTTRLLDI